MTYRFDPTQVDGYLKYSAQLRAQAFVRALGGLQEGLKAALRTVTAIVA